MPVTKVAARSPIQEIDSNKKKFAFDSIPRLP